MRFEAFRCFSCAKGTDWVALRGEGEMGMAVEWMYVLGRRAKMERLSVLGQRLATGRLCVPVRRVTAGQLHVAAGRQRD